MIPDVPEEQLRQVIEGVAAGVLYAGQIEGPPVDAFELAERLGHLVAPGGFGGARAQFVRLGGGGDGGQPTILVAEDPRSERRQWAVAHEIGESVAYQVFDQLGMAAADTSAAAREGVANRLAGCLLLPREWFAGDGTDVDWDLFELKERYATASHELIARRMLEMSPAAIVTVFDQGKLHWRRSNRANRTPPMLPVEREVWRRAHESGEVAVAEPSELPEGIEDVRAWPIHEPEWRREIVRTAVVDSW